MKKYILLLGILLLFVAGCGQAKTEKAPAAANTLQPLTIGLMPDVDSIPFIIAQEKGYFAAEGLTVTLESFKSAVDRDSALQSGKLDGAISDMLAEAFAKEGGFDTVITSLSSGSYKLIAGKVEPVKSVRELAGKEVAVSKNTIIEYVTDAIAADSGMAADALQKVVIPQIPTRLEMLKNGKIAAATLPEPLATLAIKDGGHLVSGSDTLGINPGIILFTKKAVTGKEQELQAMYRAYNKAVDYLKQQPQEQYIDLIIEKGGFPPAVKGTLVLPGYKRATAPAEQDVQQVVRWLKERGLITKEYTYPDLVDSRFVR